MFFFFISSQILINPRPQLASLRHLSRKNPQKPTWAAMKLFLRADVEKLVVASYGDEEGLEKERNARAVKALEKRIEKVRKKRKPEATKLSAAQKKSVLGKVHEHLFLVEDDQQVCRECGLRVDFEEL